VVVDLPGVGQNLSDHVLVWMGCSCKQEQPEPGVISEVGMFDHTRSGMEGTAPDLQIIFSSFLFIGTKAFIGGTRFLCPPTFLRPQSRGTVSLRSNNPLDLSVVQTNWLQCDADIQVLLRGIEIVRELVNTRAFAKVGAKELMPGPELKTAQELSNHIRSSNIWTEGHPTGTCKMGGIICRWWTHSFGCTVLKGSG
jgi:choline dehydrogenase-like flavoprotein